MLLTRLELHEVRSWQRLSLSFSEGVTVLVGPNGQGKTNVLEAIQRVASGSSHRASSDQPLVRSGADTAVIRAEVLTDAGRRRQVDLQFGSTRRLRVDGNDVRRSSEGVGVLRSVMFAPEDMAIIRGDPAERRRFLDDLLVLRRPAHAGARGDVERSLRQRNNLLRSARGLRGDARDRALQTLAAWTEQFVVHAATVTSARIAAVHALAPHLEAIYRDLADQPETVTMRYVASAGFEVTGESDGVVPTPAELAGRLREALEGCAAEEQDRGLTLVGPHRDELAIDLGNLPARGYASHGEGWSLALALKLATYDVVAEVGDRPVVLLDDVFAELDARRRRRLAAACAQWDQVIVTAAVEADVPLEGRRLDVRRRDGVSLLGHRDGDDEVAP